MSSASSDPVDRVADRTDRAFRDRPLVTGVWAGLVGTAVMTLFRLPVARSLPPTGAFWEQYAGGDPDALGPAFLLHFLYGAGGGVAFAPVARALRGRGLTTALAVGVLYGLVLSVFGTRVVLTRLLGMDLDYDEAVVFHAGHVVYGLTVGIWFGTREPHEG
ncbi:hypothetical protein [Haloprofundus halophilus]|uniref:hypothetical protein n=1 Tax=Haloprofundus halophilus TaxID=2283527 RepID=UPI000E42F1C9|nr:hypothetical protein [Haloprofundus halophilus]